MYELFLRPSDAKRTRKENWIHYGDFSSEIAAAMFARNKMGRSDKNFYVKYVDKPKTTGVLELDS